MNLNEFEEQVKKCGGKTYPLTDSEWWTIQLVYNWHPAIKDKSIIARVFTDLGMDFIEAMAPHAKALEDLDKQLWTEQAHIDARAETRQKLIDQARKALEEKKAEAEAEFAEEVKEIDQGFEDYLKPYQDKMLALVKKREELTRLYKVEVEK